MECNRFPITLNTSLNSRKLVIRMEKITKNMTFDQALKIFPQSGMVMSRMGMGCVGCMMSSSETIEQGCKAHGVDPDALIKEINTLMEEEMKDVPG